MNKRLENPFVVGRYAGSYYFCDREKETDYLIKCMKNGRDVALISPRRLGKTGLISHLFNDERIKKDFTTIFIDIYATSTLAEFISTLSQEVFKNVVVNKKTSWQKFIDIMKSIRPAITIDAVTGEPSMSLTAAKIQNPELTMSEIFEYLEGAPKRCIVAIDEFQQIANYQNSNAEALLRSYIQKSPNTRFIFAGSEHTMMDNMFHSPKKPFYQSCITLRLFPIPENIYIDFAMHLFQEYNKAGDVDVIREVYTKMGGITWFVQMMCNELFSLTPEKGKLQKEYIKIAEENIIGIQEYSYRELMSWLSPRQRELAIYLARKGSIKNILSSESVKESGFPSASSLQAALQTLLKLGIVTTTTGTDNESDGTSLYDKFFAMWLRN